MSQSMTMRLMGRFLMVAVLAGTYTMLKSDSALASYCCSDCEYELNACRQECTYQFPDQGCPAFNACQTACAHHPTWGAAGYGTCWNSCSSCIGGISPWSCFLDWNCGNNWCESAVYCY